MDDDTLYFAEDDAPREHATVASLCWRVLVVDDDPDVHAATDFALRDVRILDRPIELLSARSAAEARDVMTRERDIAVVLLDVVMESDDAGLRLVKVIRDELRLSEMRIVLRTGQPGYAPEIQAIRDYDINDYKTKSELTRTKLFTALTAAIRSYQQIRAINTNRSALDQLVRAINQLSPKMSAEAFAQEALVRLASALGLLPGQGIVCLRYGADDAGQSAQVLAAWGNHADEVGRRLTELNDKDMQKALQLAMSQGESVSGELCVSRFRGQRNRLLVGLQQSVLADDDRRRLFELFCGHLVIGLDNVNMLENLRGQAFTDSLTGLPNRASLIDMLDAQLAASDCARYTLALIDIDHFAEANDALGHAFGDELLRAVAHRLSAALDSDCRLARISGDTFAALGVSERLMPAMLLTLFAAPFVIEGQDMMLTVTLGIAHLADIDGNGVDALKGASLALRRAKMGARGEFSFYSREMAVNIRERVRLLQSLRHAIERQRLFLVYQPQINLRTGKTCGLEALLRWRGDDGQLIPPDRFIPIAEHSGLIISVGEWVMRMACFQQAELARHGYGGLRMAINVSVTQLRHPRFLSAFRTALEDSGVNPSCIELEITESVAMLEADFLGHMFEQIKALGVQIALDDFGTGFSSLSYLQRLSVNRLKIDRSFINDVSSSGAAKHIPALVVQLGQTLGLAVIAEGVEVQEQADVLLKMGCDEAQGYLFARPMEVPQLLEWLAARS
ncbi:MAG: EAL domain-containing protein [Rhodocyclaceae bacterium]